MLRVPEKRSTKRSHLVSDNRVAKRRTKTEGKIVCDFSYMRNLLELSTEKV